MRSFLFVNPFEVLILVLCWTTTLLLVGRNTIVLPAHFFLQLEINPLLKRLQLFATVFALFFKSSLGIVHFLL